MPQHELIELFVYPLEDSGLEYMITGSVASILYGEPRLTHDIDLILHVNANELEQIPKIFPANTYYVPPVEVLRTELSRTYGARFNLIHHDSGTKADFYFATGDFLHQWGISKKRRVDIGNNHAVWLAPPEYVIIRKLQYFREGESQKHLRDIAGMIAASAPLIDKTVLFDFLEKMHLKSIWDSANLPRLK
jgi:hypothetical protein